MLINNKNELIVKIKQGDIMAVAKGDLSRCVASTGADPTGLGIRNYADVENGKNKLRFVSSCQSVKS